MHAQIRAKASGAHTVPTVEVGAVDTKHIESMVGSGMQQEEKLQCKLWDGRIYCYHTQELTLVEE